MEDEALPSQSTERQVEALSTSSTAGPADIGTKLQWLMFMRVIMITLFLGWALVLQARSVDRDPVTDRTLLSVIVATYVLTIAYSLALRRVRRLNALAYSQLILDMLLIAIVVWFTGGTESYFLFMYSLTVLNAAILLFRRGAVYLSAVATGLIVLQVTRETTGWLMERGPAGPLELRGVFLSGMTNVGAVFFVALLAGYLSEQLRDTGQRLRSASRNLEALRVLNEHIVNSIQSGLVSFALDFEVLFFNPAAARITGIDPDTALFDSVLKIFPQVETRRNDPDAVRRWEETFHRPDGRRSQLGLSLSPLLDHQTVHRGWILSFQDLTELRRMEFAIKRSERFAAIGKMAAGIAHEIRNPLASMSGSIEMLKGSEQLDDTQQKLMGIVLRETDRLNDLITDFLKFARPGRPRYTDIDLPQELAEIDAMFEHRIGALAATNLELVLEIEPALKLRADPAHLRQILWNLINNAAQAMPDGGRIMVRARGHRRDVIITVEDQGNGIPAEAVERIFDPFFTTRDNGSGLGLALVHRMVDEHEGTIQVNSIVDVGTTFVLQFPAAGASPMSDRHDILRTE